MRSAGPPLIGAALLLGCASPQLGTDIAQTRTLLAELDAAARPALALDAADDLGQAEAALARQGRAFLVIPDDCTSRISGALGTDVSDCTPVSLADEPRLDGTVNSAQALALLDKMDAYFAALSALATATTPAGIRSNADKLTIALQDAATAFAGAGLADGIAERGPAVAAGLGIVAERIRLAEMRRHMKAAQGVFDEALPLLADQIEEVAGDARLHRTEMLDAIGEYERAAASGRADAQIRAARDLRNAARRMHMAEATSPVRRLHQVVRRHRAMLARIDGPPTLEDIDGLTADIAEINTFLET
ncbi:MAG: hypothetical protein AAF366_03415 [Pseudomonadota bacterium]